MLIVLVQIADAKVAPLCSTYLNVIGDEVDWSEMTVLFAGAGADWSGAAFFPIAGPTAARSTTRQRARGCMSLKRGSTKAGSCSTKGTSSTSGDAGSRLRKWNYNDSQCDPTADWSWFC